MIKDRELFKHFPFQLTGHHKGSSYNLTAFLPEQAINCYLVCSFNSPEIKEGCKVVYLEPSIFSEENPKITIESLVNLLIDKAINSGNISKIISENSRIYLKKVSEEVLIISSGPDIQNVSKNQGVKFFNGPRNSTPLVY